MTKESIADRYESALRWVSTELAVAEANQQYLKGTLISNLRDRVQAALAEGPYRPRQSGLLMLNHARDLAEEAHAGQLYGDVPYTFHLNAVEEIAQTLDPEDWSLLCAAQLHDTLEDTKTTKEDLDVEFPGC